MEALGRRELDLGQYVEFCRQYGMRGYVEWDFGLAERFPGFGLNDSPPFFSMDYPTGVAPLPPVNAVKEFDQL